MIPLIQQALTMGYTAAQVLSFLGNKIPNLQKGIQQSLSRGYSDTDVLKFLAGKIPVSNKADVEKQSNAQQDYLSKNGIKSRGERQEDRSRFIKGAFGAGVVAAGAWKAYQNYGNLSRGLRGMIGGQPQQQQQLTPNAPQQPAQQMQGPAPTPSPMQQTPGQQIGAQVQQPTQIPPGVAQTPPQSPGIPSNPPQSAGNMTNPQGNPANSPGNPPESAANSPQTQIDIPKLLASNPRMEKKINDLKGSGNGPEEIAGYFRKFKPEVVAKIEKETGQPFEQVIEQVAINAEQPGNESAEKPLAVGSEVITPDGDIATIDLLPGKTAKAKVDGKDKVFETENLTAVPENKEEILGIYDKLIQAIPESARSTLAAAIGYDAKNNKVQIKFHDGSSYIYDDIDQEDIDSIINLENLAKTSGGNYFGVYAQGEASLGAGVSSLIQKLQKKYGGKGKEYSAKFKEVYSLYGIPEGLRRDREKKEREERKKAKRDS